MISLKMVKGSELAEGVQLEMPMPTTMTRLVIGRDPATHWPIPDRTLALSARHCELLRLPAGLVLRDLSTNGTFVNGNSTRLAGDHLLHDGDRIELGPYAIAVHGAPPRVDAAVPTAAPVAVAPAPARREASVQATAPLRGGDPAAMLGSGGANKREGLTEILRHAPPAEDESTEVTKIRLAPKSNAAAPAARPAGTTPMPVVGAPAAAVLSAPIPSAPIPSASIPSAPFPPASAPPGPAAPLAAADTVPAALQTSTAGVAREASPAMPTTAGGTPDPVLAALTTGLGLPADALAGADAAEAVLQVAMLARASVTALRQLLEQQTQARRQIGSRATALGAVRELSPLRLANSPEAALLMLLAPGANAGVAVQAAAAELAAHQGRLLKAFRDAAQRLGEDIAPASLEAALGAARPGETPAQHQARLWGLYTQVWQGLGLAPGEAWSQGFLEAALLHLASAYDKVPKA